LVHQPFERLIQQQARLAHKCTGFWQCMDTFKDKQRLEELNDGRPPWKVWSERERAAALSYRPAAKVA
jgi:glucose-1-phosphate cytidylyltransferase